MSHAPMEPVSPWLGGRPFRIALALALLLLFVGTALTHQRVQSLRQRVLPNVTLLGADRVTAGKPETYRVIVINAVDGTPIAQAGVQLLCMRDSADGNEGLRWPLGMAQTNSQGEAKLDVTVPAKCIPKPGRSRVHGASFLVARVNVLGNEQHDSIELNRSGTGSLTAVLATDKPIYQPGQTIRMRALFLGRDGQPAKDTQATLEVVDPKGNKVFKKQLRTSAFGNVHADFVLADQVNLGTYEITVHGYDAQTKQMVEVKRYALPKFNLVLDVSSRTAEPASNLSGVVRATWVFGKPVQGAATKVWLTKSGSSSSLAEVGGVTKDDGSFPCELKVPSEVGSYELHANVTTEGGDERASTVSLEVSIDEVTAELVPDGGPLVGGVENDAFVLARLADGTPARAHVRVVPDGPTVLTDGGIARVRFTPRADQRLRIVRPDGGGDRGEFPLPKLVESPDAAVLVQTDYSAYESGQLVRVFLRGTSALGGTVYVDLAKARRVLVSGACTITQGACELALRLPREASGLVRVRALRVTAEQVGFASRFVLVQGGEDLDVRVVADRAVHAPGATARLDLGVTRMDGSPVAAALSLAGVDEAVFALVEARPDLQAFFLRIGKDLRAEAEAGTPVFRKRGRWAPTNDFAPDASKVSAALGTEGGENALARDAMLATLAAKAPRPAGLDFTMKDAKQLGAYGWFDAESQLWGKVVLVPGLLFLLACSILLAYAWRRVREGRVPVVLTEDEVQAWKTTTRGLLVWWFLPFVAPFPVLIFVSLLMHALNLWSDQDDEVFMASIVLTTVTLGAVLARSWRRSLRTKVGWALSGLGQVGWLLPIAPVLFWAGLLVPTLAGTGVATEYLRSKAGMGIAASVLVVFAQLVFGALSVLRNASAHDTTLRGRVWLLLSRATFVGLPVALTSLGFFVTAFSYQSSYDDDVWEDSADNKEGGSGTRARGEEGSMGSPGGMAQQAPRVRKHFPETLLWAPEVLTDARGRAHLEIPLADSITTWRVSASAISMAGGMGHTTASLRVMQDFFGDVTVPERLTQKDETAVPVTVFNYVQGRQTVQVVLEVDDGLRTVGAAQQRVDLGPGEVKGIAFKMQAVRPGTHGVRVRLIGTRLTDALERKVRVVPDGYRVEQSLNGTLPEEPRIVVDFPKEAIAGGSDLYVKVYDGVVSQMAEALDGGFRRPYGCFEQTSSVTYPNVLMLRYLRGAQRTSPEAENKALAYIELGKQRLLSFEVPGGGFSLFGSAPASASLSAYGLLEFHDMGEVVDVDPALIARTREWLYGQQQANGTWVATDHGSLGGVDAKEKEWIRTTSYTAWAIAETGDRDPRLARALDRVEAGDAPDAQESYTLALRALALAAGERTQAAKGLLEKLVAQGVRESNGLHWTSETEGVTWSRGTAMQIELTGLIVQAMARVDGWPEERAAALLWLASRRDSLGTWHSTQSTVAAMRALLTAVKPSRAGQQTAAIRVNGQAAAQVVIPEEERDVFRLVSLRDHVVPGANVIELGAKDQDLGYQVVTVHYLPWAKAPVGARRESIELAVSYPQKSVKVGEWLEGRAEVRWNRESPARMTLLELAIPPGFSPDLEGFDKLVKERAISRYGMEGRRMIVYLDGLSMGQPVTVPYRLQALVAGRVAAPSSAAYAYYEPEVRAETEPVVLTAR
jgi:5-hydroxyisourate hydrolase-like protein (transthyretin family)